MQISLRGRRHLTSVSDVCGPQRIQRITGSEFQIDFQPDW